MGEPLERHLQGEQVRGDQGRGEGAGGKLMQVGLGSKVTDGSWILDPISQVQDPTTQWSAAYLPARSPPHTATPLDPRHPLN